MKIDSNEERIRNVLTMGKISSFVRSALKRGEKKHCKKLSFIILLFME